MSVQVILVVFVLLHLLVVSQEELLTSVDGVSSFTILDACILMNYCQPLLW